MNKLWCVWCRKDCKLTVHALLTLNVCSNARPRVPSVTRLVSFPLPPSFSSSFTPPAASFNNTWDAESGEGKRERLHAKTFEEIHKKGGGQRGGRGLKTLLSCRSARWLDGRLWRGRRGQLTGEAGACLFFPPPPSNIRFKSVSIRPGELSSVEEVHCQ